MKKLQLKRGEDRRARAGHLWIFSNEADTGKTPLTDFSAGEDVIVTDSRGSVIGSACVNPHSLICARIHARNCQPLDADLLRARISDALALRQRLFHDPYYRLVFGEGDFLPGLVIDRYDTHLTFQITTAAMEKRRDIISEIVHDLIAPASVCFDNTVAARSLEGLETGSRLFEGNVPDELHVLENGITYIAPAKDGQKTGYFYDQRDNHRLCAGLAEGCDVLDVFSYVGGFGVACMKNGASSCVYVDSSARALACCARNHEAAAPGRPCECLQSDAFDALKDLRSQGRSFDIVSIDPPAFIKRRKDYKEGLNAYRRLNYLALQLVRDGGFLVTSSCSQLLSGDDLRRVAATACAKQNIHPRLIYAGRQGMDHPVHCAMPETAYLKCLIIQCTHQPRPEALKDTLKDTGDMADSLQ